MEKARQEAIKQAKIDEAEKQEIERKTQEEAVGQRLDEQDERYQEMVERIRFEQTIEFIVEQRPETARAIISGIIGQPQIPQEE